MDDLVHKLSQQLLLPLPGPDAQYEMAPLDRPRINATFKELQTFKSSAVLILLYKNSENNWNIPLIKRVKSGGVHSGQISLPGGSFDESDVNLEQTAVRETFEEIGVSNINVLGGLTELYIPVSRFKVQPFIAVTEVLNPEFNISTSEVEHLVELPLMHLMQNFIRKEGLINLADAKKIKAPYFDVQGNIVWGATAMILSELRTVLKTIY